jgi:DNA-directed RNA polymerase specialized sigma24 family protein
MGDTGETSRERRNGDRPSGVYGPMYVQTRTTRRPAFGTAPSSGPPGPPPSAANLAFVEGVELVPHDVGTVGLEFDDFYRSSWSGVARALSLALGDRDLAVEATDEAMARAYPRWGKLRSYDNPAAWVYRVGLNWARSHHRRLARKLPFSRSPVADPVAVTEPAVREALMALSFKHRSVVVCRLLLDWSVADTAQALGIRPGTVQSRLHRALQLLESSLQHLR